MTSQQSSTNSLEIALQHCARLLEAQPALAAEQAREILLAAPGNALAELYQALAQRALGNGDAALQRLAVLVAAQPNWAAAHYEYGVTLASTGSGDAAIGALRRAVQLKPDFTDAWRALGDHLNAIGDAAGADRAYAAQIKAATHDPRLLEPAAALCDGRIGVAEALLREHLKQFPTDVAALRMLAEVAARLGRYSDAEHLLARCLELAPGFTAARQNYALVLHRENKPTEALAEVNQLLTSEPRNPSYRNLKAAVLVRIGEYAAAMQLYQSVLADYPQQAKVWMSYGHALKTSGQQQPSIDAYRRSIALAPNLGEAYWSLANLKTFRFAASELDAMRTQLARSDISDDDRVHLHFAIGKALEDDAQYAQAFAQYAAGNALHRTRQPYDAAETTRNVARATQLFTREFFTVRPGGAADADPIFIVGLPRAGSTLLEQILASHSQVEGTMELPNIISLARELGERQSKSSESKYPQMLANLDATQRRELGERYLEQTRIHRKTRAPFFIDKMPNNWAHVGLIHLILPNAKIIDARRHPLGCCFSGFKQHFARGQAFSYSFDDLGHYYRDYVALLMHFDTVLPGRVHRVIYESMVSDTETEVRRLLEYCGLPFEAQCLRFYENARAVRTASSEQVRQPIYRDGVDQWQHFAAWLDPLQRALGPALDGYNAPLPHTVSSQSM